jgi:hypothetical protein
VGPPARRLDRVRPLLDDEPAESFAARLVEAEGVLLLPGA